MKPGTVFTFAVDPARQGLGKVVGVDGDVVGVALCGAVWECEPLLDDIDDAPIAVGHLPVRAARLADVTVLGERPVTDEDRAIGYAKWAELEPGARPVVDAPLSILIGALI